MDAGTESGADSEDGEEDIGDVVGQQPSVELGQRRHDKWPNRQAKIVHGDDQSTENTAFILKVLHSFFHSRGGNGRPKSAAISFISPWTLAWLERVNRRDCFYSRHKRHGSQDKNIEPFPLRWPISCLLWIPRSIEVDDLRLAFRDAFIDDSTLL